MDEGIGTKEVLEVIKAKKINISVITLLFTFLSIIYCLKIAVPIYEYNALIRIPAGIESKQVNSLVEILKNDIKPDCMLEDKYNKLTKVNLLRDTSLIKITWEGTSPKEAESQGLIYTNNAMERIDKIIVLEQKKEWENSAFWIIEKDLENIKYNFADNNINESLSFLENEIQLQKKEMFFQKAELIKSSYVLDRPVRPQILFSVIGTFFFSLILSSTFFIGKYYIKNNR